MSFSGQLPLHIGLHDSATFDSFYGAQNVEVVSHIQRLAQHRDEPFVYLWGGPASGKSHLLLAAAGHVARSGKRIGYLPMSQLGELDTAILDGMEQSALVCVDDVQCICGSALWEEALFHLFNRLRQAGVPLLVGGNCKPQELDLQLPDLQSRLNWGLMLQLKPMNEQEKAGALQLRAKLRGLFLSDEVTQFILRRCPRDMHSLMSVLQYMDNACLAAKRKPTVPFVKSLLDVSLSELLSHSSQTPT